jgi:hypothetical protein
MAVIAVNGAISGAIVGVYGAWDKWIDAPKQKQRMEMLQKEADRVPGLERQIAKLPELEKKIQNLEADAVKQNIMQQAERLKGKIPAPKGFSGPLSYADTQLRIEEGRELVRVTRAVKVVQEAPIRDLSLLANPERDLALLRAHIKTASAELRAFWKSQKPVIAEESANRLNQLEQLLDVAEKEMGGAVEDAEVVVKIASKE